MPKVSGAIVAALLGSAAAGAATHGKVMLQPGHCVHAGGKTICAAAVAPRIIVRHDTISVTPGACIAAIGEASTMIQTLFPQYTALTSSIISSFQQFITDVQLGNWGDVPNITAEINNDNSTVQSLNTQWQTVFGQYQTSVGGCH